MITKENILLHLIEYQLKMIGKDLSATKVDNWYSINTMSESQYNEFKDYAVDLYRKTYKCSKIQALARFDSFDLQYGLRVV